MSRDELLGEDGPLWRWLDRRMYLQLATMSEQDATRCARNTWLQPERAKFWSSEALHYLDRAVQYRDKAKALR